MENPAEKTENLAEKMGKYVNTLDMRDRSKAFIGAFITEHRTLQQAAFKMMLELLEFMASPEYRTDGRNEQSKAVATKLINGFKAEYHKQLLSEGVPEDRLKDFSGEHFLPSKFLGFI